MVSCMSLLLSVVLEGFRCVLVGYSSDSRFLIIDRRQVPSVDQGPLAPGRSRSAGVEPGSEYGKGGRFEIGHPIRATATFPSAATVKSRCLDRRARAAEDRARSCRRAMTTTATTTTAMSERMSAYSARVWPSSRSRLTRFPWSASARRAPIRLLNLIIWFLLVKLEVVDTGAVSIRPQWWNGSRCLTKRY